MSSLRERGWRFLKSKDRNVVLICFGIALIFWLTTKFSEEYSNDYTFALEFDLPENSSFSSPPTDEMTARITGSGWDLFMVSLRRGFSTLHVPITTRSEITRTDLVQALYRHLGDKPFEVRDVDVDVIDLDIDMMIQKDVLVQFDGRLQYAQGYHLKDSIHINPASVRLTGPVAVVEDIQFLRLAPVDIPALQQTFRAQVDIEQPQSDYVAIEPASVELIIPVEPLVQKVLSVPIAVDGDTSGIGISPDRVRVTCSLGESKRDTLTAEMIDAHVKIDQIARTAGKAHIDIQSIPHFVRMATLSPEEVDLVVREEE